MNDVELQDGMSLLPRKAAMKSSRHTLDVEGLIEEDKSPNTVSEGLSNIKEVGMDHIVRRDPLTFGFAVFGKAR